MEEEVFTTQVIWDGSFMPHRKNHRKYTRLLMFALQSFALFFYTAAVCNEDHFITCTHHVLHTVHTGGVHDLNLVGILRRDPMFLSLVIQQLDLSRVRELYRCTNRYLKLPTSCVVEPDLVPLQRR